MHVINNKVAYKNLVATRRKVMKVGWRNRVRAAALTIHQENEAKSSQQSRSKRHSHPLRGTWHESQSARAHRVPGGSFHRSAQGLLRRQVRRVCSRTAWCAVVAPYLPLAHLSARSMQTILQHIKQGISNFIRIKLLASSAHTFSIGLIMECVVLVRCLRACL